MRPRLLSHPLVRRSAALALAAAATALALPLAAGQVPPTPGAPGTLHRTQARLSAALPPDERSGPVTLAAPTAWETASSGAQGPLVAVIDTGVVPAGRLSGRVEAGQSFVGGVATGDENGHGTGVAGIIAGPAGMCGGCRILPLQVAGASGTATSDSIAAAIDAAVAQGAAVINLSMVANMATDAERGAIGRAVAAGVVVVAAAGNSGSSEPTYPSSYPGVLSVGAAGEDGRVADFSSRGPWVGVLAPACGITLDRSGAEARFCGTSASAPYVAAVAAVLRAAAPAATGADVIAAIERSAHPTEGSAYGIVDASAALAALAGTSQPVPAAAPAPAQAGQDGQSSPVAVTAGAGVLTRAERTSIRARAGSAARTGRIVAPSSTAAPGSR